MGSKTKKVHKLKQADAVFVGLDGAQKPVYFYWRSFILNQIKTAPQTWDDDVKREDEPDLWGTLQFVMTP